MDIPLLKFHQNFVDCEKNSQQCLFNFLTCHHIEIKYFCLICFLSALHCIFSILTQTQQTFPSGLHLASKAVALSRANILLHAKLRFDTLLEKVKRGKIMNNFVGIFFLSLSKTHERNLQLIPLLFMLLTAESSKTQQIFCTLCETSPVNHRIFDFLSCAVE